MADKHISREVEVAVGDSFTVTLCSNPTMGFQWSESAQISDEAMLKQVGHEFVPPEDENVVGVIGLLIGLVAREMWKKNS